jgi:SAM-dependent methyltransferase
VFIDSISELDARAPHLQENLWGYGKRLCFVDGAVLQTFPGRKRCDLRVLDVGCGNGSQLAGPLAVGGYKVTGVDPHLPSIERGRRLSPAVSFVHGVVSSLPPSMFHCVIISEVLEHLVAPEVLLSSALSYLAPSGVLIITVPNGYGEFELDLRLYQALRMDKLVARLYDSLRTGRTPAYIAGSDDESPHIQRFTVSDVRKLFERNNLQLLEARGTSLVSGPIVLHLLGRFQSFVRLNAAVADYLPWPLASGWMFALKRATAPNAS